MPNGRNATMDGPSQSMLKAKSRQSGHLALVLPAAYNPPDYLAAEEDYAVHSSVFT